MKKVWFQDWSWPKCFDSPEQLEQWRQAMLQSKHTSYSVWVCIDCTPTYQMKMKQEGRCENPHVKFKKEYEHKPNNQPRDEDWSIIGFVSDKDYKLAKIKRKIKKSMFDEHIQRTAQEPTQTEG